MRPSVFVAAAATVLAFAGAEPAVAGTAPSTATTSTATTSTSTATAPRAVPAGMQRVELALAPRDATALTALATTGRALTPAGREARRQAALPGAARAHEVADKATALGLTVISTNDTDVTVAGTPSLVRSLFGSARANRSALPTAQALPALPPSLAGLVLVAAGGDETRPSHLPRNNSDGSLSQAEFQRVFGVPASTSPPTASSPTVATLQFSGWTPSDLTTYVQTQHIYGSTSYDPVTGGGYSAVPIDGGADDSSQSLEVALDQEAIATMAPGVRQRTYFISQVPVLGQADAINQVAADAPSQHIVALSTSWGLCEPDAYRGPNDPVLKADRAALDNALAAGVTVFAASGDSGSDDCTPDPSYAGTNTVDVPAAFPEVVGVGGTSVRTGSGGTTQTAWGNDHGATGGGYSSLFPRPSYQSGAVTGSMRGVPDIAMDGDPQTGLHAYASGPDGCGTTTGWCGVGGTSLSAPLAAASLGSILADRGATRGLGDIHPLLYAAAATSYTDITSGSNGAYSAGPGWDPTTGLGAPLWSNLLAVAAGTTPYVAIDPIRVVDTRTGTGDVATHPLIPGGGYAFRLTGTALPLGQEAYAFNVTAIHPTGPGNLKLTPACGSAGTSSLVNYQPGKDSANFVIAPDPNGCDAFTLTSAGSAVNVAIDAVGYYTSGFTSVTPTRIVDTRPDQGLGGTGPIAAGGVPLSFTVPNLPAGTKAVAINVTAIGPTGLGNLRVYPDSGGAAPDTSNINYIPGVTKAAFAVVQVPADGKIDVASAGSPVDVAIDVFGSYPSTSTLVTASPVRVLDTRAPGLSQGLPSPLAAGTAYPVQVTGGSSGVPADAQAVLVSLTAIHAATSTGAGNLAAYPTGQSPPTVSTINYVSSTSDVANFAIVKVGAGGMITLRSNGSPIDAALDILGYVPAG